MCLLLALEELSKVRGMCRGKLAMRRSRLCIRGPFLGLRPVTTLKAWESDLGIKHRAERVGAA